MATRDDVPAAFNRTCRKCGGRCERVATLPKSIEKTGYEIYQCLDCKFIEWFPQDQ
jgi:hypothetical protein